MRISHALCVLRDDIRAIFRNDPAARNLAEVLLYPGLHAIILHRFAHALYRRKVPFIPRLISQISRFLTGIEIHPGARIGRGFFIDHGMGVVIGETAEIGDWVMLYQGVTLGGTGKQTGKRHPTVEDEVVIGVGAIVLGAITIGRGARIGGGAVVVKDVPPHSTAVGVPARIVARRDPITGVSRRVEQLPDPEGEMLRSLHDKVLELEARLIELEAVSRVHYKNFHVKHSELPEQLWQTLLDESAPVEEEYNQGAGI
ncbi:serine O-acetyltransferase EpsC [Chloroflexus aggregans]|uniref:Serine acetyltransferase n=1 Tax=Chloroflexus aggregans (strain MD-66 / DSM 9485) TaxID=326427 RepID=B8GAN8_CHLAD|nr:serine O-acetyltransferase EpsC [Chloroflexus aggregans]ACL24627.1 serine O-acetyltransferase [Chloroflexus aggregans DSM 9485]